MKLNHYKNLVFLNDVDIGNLLICNKFSSGEKNYKYFFGYIDDDYKIKPLRIIPSKTNAYI